MTATSPTDTTPPKHSPRNYGMAWGIGGWLLVSFLQSRRRDDWTTEARVAAELTTTFASTYTREVSLAGMLKPDAFTSYVKRATVRGEVPSHTANTALVCDGRRSSITALPMRGSGLSRFPLDPREQYKGNVQ